MHPLDPARYHFQQPILSSSHGTLYIGKDSSLKRRVLLYVMKRKPNTSDQEFLRLIMSVAGFSHPRFFHILDAGLHRDGVFAVLETRDGVPLVDRLHMMEADRSTFEHCLSVVIKLGSSLDLARENRIRGFPLTADNVWLTEEGEPMILNCWLEGEKHQRGTLGLVHLLYQLLARTTDIPSSYGMLRERLQNSLPLYGIAPRKREALLRLVGNAYREQDSAFSFLLGLSQLSSSSDENEQSVGVPDESAHAESVQVHAARLEDPDDFRDVPGPSNEESVVPTRLPPFSVKFKWLIASAAFAIILLAAFVAFFSPQTPGSEEAAGTPVQPVPPQSDSAPSEPDQEQPEKELVEFDAEQKSPGNTPSPSAAEHAEITNVPDLVGLMLEEAEKQALAAGLRYQYFLERNEAEPGVVFKQDLAAESTVPRETRITFWVSKGP